MIARAVATGLILLAAAAAAAGAALRAPSPGVTVAVAPRSASVEAGAPLALTVRIRRGGRPLLGPAPHLVARLGSRRIPAVVRRLRAGTYRATLVLRAPGSWQLQVRVSGRSHAAGAVTVRPGLTIVLDVAALADGSLLVSDFAHRVFRARPGGPLTVVAGSGRSGSGGDGGPARSARVGFPVEVAPGPRGGFGVVSDERAVRHVAESGRIRTVAALAQPTALAYDSRGDLFVSLLGGRVVRIDAASGVVSPFAGAGEQGFGGGGGPAVAALLNRPHGLVVDERGVFVCDTFNNRIRSIDVRTGRIETFAADLNQPNDIALGPDRALYVSDYGNDRVARIDARGVVSTVARASGPNAVAVGADGLVLFTERGRGWVRAVDPGTGQVTTVLGR